MPYRKNPLFAGGYYHVFNRGTEKRDIFLDRKDKERFLTKLIKYLEEEQVSLLAFCLMPNHFHLLVKQSSDKAISTFMRKLCTAHSMYFNKRYNRVGPLFQGRFKANLIESEAYLLQVSRYINLNPLELILDKLKDGSSEKTRPLISACLLGYSWSSFHEYLGEGGFDICNLELLDYFSKSYQDLSYKNFVLDGVKDFIEGKLASEDF